MKVVVMYIDKKMFFATRRFDFDNCTKIFEHL